MFPFWIFGIIIIIAGLSVFWSWSWLIGLIMMVGGAVMLILYFMIAPKFPVTAIIFQRREGGYKMMMDKCGRFRTGPKEDTYEYRFRKTKDTCPAAKFDNLYQIGKRDYAYFFTPAPGEYYPMVIKEARKMFRMKVPSKDDPTKLIDVDVDGFAIQPIEDDLHSWFVQKAKRMKQKYENMSGWDRYYPVIIVVVLAIALILIFNSVLSGLNKVSQIMDDAAQKNLEAVNSMAAANQRLADALQGKQSGSSTPSIPAPPDVG